MEQKEKFEAASVIQGLKKAMFVSSAAVTVCLVALDRYEIMRGMSAETAFEKNIFVSLAPFVLSGAAIYKMNRIIFRLYCKCRLNGKFAAGWHADKVLKTVLQTVFNVFIFIRLLRLSAASCCPDAVLWIETVSIWLGVSVVVIFAVWIISRLWLSENVA